MIRRTGLALIAVLGASAAVANDPAPAWVDAARASAASLGGQLKQALRSAMAEGGPAAGIGVCEIQAPQIAGEVSSRQIHVGRTALKVRNPANAPDGWESRMLEAFERRLAAGEPPEQIETFAIRDDGQRRYGHWMKAIPTQGLCTACHGAEIPPEVADAIEQAYPDDQARGFSVGDLRGAFTVEIDLGAD